jgi:hypothetical protein
MEQAQQKGPLTDKAYRDSLATNHRLTSKQGIDALWPNTNWMPSWDRLPQPLGSLTRWPGTALTAAVLRLLRSLGIGTLQCPPTRIPVVDNPSAGFPQGGKACTSHTSAPWRLHPDPDSYRFPQPEWFHIVPQNPCILNRASLL